MNDIFPSRYSSRRHGRNLLFAIAMGALAMAGAATVSAQSTAGKIFGTAPVGYSVTAMSDSTGAKREVTVPSNGHYAIRALPVGTYTVTLKEGSDPVMKHLNVPVVVSRGSKVDFHCTAGKCVQTAGK